MEEIKRVQLSEVAELITKGTTPTTIGFEFQEQGVNFLKIECFDAVSYTHLTLPTKLEV